MLASIRNHPLRSGAAGVALVFGLAWLAFGYFGVHTLFIDDVVDEAGPVFDVPAVDADRAAAPAATEGIDESAAATGAPEVVAEFSGTFVDRAHPTAGIATVLGNGTDQRFLRFENFETDNGPDLNVYLRNPDTGDFIDLGDLKGNIGSQNYEIPADVDLTEFSVVDIWCVRFGVGFGQAELMPA